MDKEKIKKITNVLSRVKVIPKRKFTPMQIIKFDDTNSHSESFRSTASWVGNRYCFIKKGFLREKLLERVEEGNKFFSKEKLEYYDEGYIRMFEEMKVGDNSIQLFPLALLPIRKKFEEIGDRSEPLILLDKKEKDELVAINMRYFKLFVDSASDKEVEFYQKEDAFTDIEIRFDEEIVGYVMPSVGYMKSKGLSGILLRRLRRKFDV